jgi:hypothetical protein
MAKFQAPCEDENIMEYVELAPSEAERYAWFIAGEPSRSWLVAVIARLMCLLLIAVEFETSIEIGVTCFLDHFAVLVVRPVVAFFGNHVWPVVSSIKCSVHGVYKVCVVPDAVTRVLVSLTIHVVAAVAVVAIVLATSPPSLQSTITHSAHVDIPAWYTTYKGTQDMADVPHHVQYLVLHDVMTQRRYPDVFDHMLEIQTRARDMATRRHAEFRAVYEKSRLADVARMERLRVLVFGGVCSYEDKPLPVNTTEIAGVTFTPRFYHVQVQYTVANTKNDTGVSTTAPNATTTPSGLAWEFVNPPVMFRVLSV